MSGFRKCPKCGDLSSERRTRCICGYREDEPPSKAAPSRQQAQGTPESPYHTASRYSIRFGVLAWLATSVGDRMLREAIDAADARAVSTGFLICIALLVLCGIVAAVYALRGMSEHGRRGILWRSIVGLGLCGSLLALFSLPFVAPR